MKKYIFLLVLGVAAETLWSQGVLPGYDGFWAQYWHSGDITVLDIVDYYPNRLGYLRNEIYARYGRAFATRAYQDYFNSQRWYHVRSDFSESWLSAEDRRNAELIRSIEQAPLGLDETRAALLTNIQYTNASVSLTFVSATTALWNDPDVFFSAYGLNNWNHDTLPYVIMGNWVLLYAENYHNIDDNYEVTAYELDHAAKKITGSTQGYVRKAALDFLIRAQEK